MIIRQNQRKNILFAVRKEIASLGSVLKLEQTCPIGKSEAREYAREFQAKIPEEIKL